MAVTVRVAGARRLFGLFAVFLAALLVAFVVPSDLGSNVERLKFAAIPLALLAATIAPKRILLVVPLVAVAGFWNLSALAHTARTASADPGHHRVYWQPAIHFLRAHLSPSYRVEAVDTAEHWPAAYLPDAGIPIVRGWYRQNDFPQNELLYDEALGGPAYRAWLRGLGVRYVVITDAPPDYSARARGTADPFRPLRSRARLPQPARHGLRAARREPDRHRPLRRDHSLDVADAHRLLGRRAGPLPRQGALVAVLAHLQGCVWRGKDGTVRVQARNAGLVDLRVNVNVSSGLATLAGLTPRRTCGGQLD